MLIKTNFTFKNLILMFRIPIIARITNGGRIPPTMNIPVMDIQE